MDKSTGQKVRLTDADAELVQRMRRGLYADADFDPYKVNIVCACVRVLSAPRRRRRTIHQFTRNTLKGV